MEMNNDYIIYQRSINCSLIPSSGTKYHRIRLRVTYNGKRIDLHTRIRVEPKYWNSKTQRVKRGYTCCEESDITINAALNTYIKYVNLYFMDCERNFREPVLTDLRDKSDSMQRVMESLWPGMWDAVQTIVNPRLDKYVMFDEEKETIRKALCKEPEISLANASWMIDAARTIREIVNGTKAEVYEIAAESGVDYLRSLGLDIAEDVVEDVDKVAATTACLFFGYFDGATTISESCGGGGGNNELPKKKDNEDELSFARRCHQMAKIMHAPKYRLRR